MNDQKIILLPDIQSAEFAGLVGLAAIGPYLFICGIYAYHFAGRSRPGVKKLRESGDSPEDKHINDWQTALFRPEGISAVVVYMLANLAMSLLFPQKLSWLVPESIKTLSFDFKLVQFMMYFLVFDSTMWVIHFVQHRWRWLYHATHAVHHTITSPTMICALTGFWKDTALLILLPLHVTILAVPNSNFFTVFLFSLGSLLHLHAIHSEFEHAWDPFFRKVGIVNSHDHHVHHLKPRKNLAHFFVAIDKLFGTYEDPATVGKIVH
jgi:sterol desaturase/sphingolipid hydroxylase (fatty acid hydroxylase superfamily)